MRRNARMKNREGKSLNDKIIKYSIIGIAVLAVILVGLLMYSKSLSDNVKEGTMTLEQMANIAGNNTESTESASMEMGKSVEESKNEINQTNDTNAVNTTNTINTTNSTNVNANVNNAKTNTTKSTNTSKQTSAKSQSSTENKETKKELSFTKPVDGEIMRDYAKDNLIYSETLKEWVTHMGIDIKAEKTTVVKSAEDGTVKSIKNDPRYGLTIVIEHEDGFQTVYSNLLTS